MRACLRISFGATATSTSTWTVTVKQTGRKRILARRSSRVRAGARVTRVLKLPPKLACGRPLTVTIRVRGATGLTQTVRHLPRGRACRVPS